MVVLLELDKGSVKKILFIVIVSILVFLGVQNFNIVVNLTKMGIGIMRPFIVGVCIAFTFNVLLKVVEEKAFAPLNKMNNLLWKKCRRGISILLTYAIVTGVLFILFFLIVPELKKSFAILVQNVNVYSTVFQGWTDKLINTFNISPDIAANLRIDWSKIFDVVSNFITSLSNNFINKTVNITSAIISGIVSLVIGIAFSIYMLIQKEKLCDQAKRICLAFLSRRRAEYLISVGKLSNKIFSKFVLGQLTEAVIIGLLCFIGMKIFSMPYASLIATIVGCTSLIPVVGAFLGTIVGVFILLMIKPITAFWFVVFIIVLQQIEGNIIYPRVVGNSIGLPGIWVLLAVTVGGNTFGIMGMLLGIPLSSICYCLFKIEVAKRLKKREITSDDVKNSGTDLLKTR